MNTKRLCLCVTFAALAATMTGCGQKVYTYTTDDYVDVNVSGASGKAHAAVYFDKDNFYPLINRDLFDGKASDVDLASMEVHLYDAVKINASETDNLSNGDVITISLTADNDKLKEYGVSFAGDTYTYTVEGLEEVRMINPFDDLSISFEGISSSGNVKVEYVGNDDFLKNNVTYRVNPSINLKNGDEIEIQAASDNKEDFNVEFTAESMSCEVTGLDEYISEQFDTTEIDKAMEEYLRNVLSLSSTTINHSRQT